MGRLRKLHEMEDDVCRYASDRIRYDYLKSAISSEPTDAEPDMNALRAVGMGLDGYPDKEYDDLTFVAKRKDGTIDYWEGFVKSCWDGLFGKPEYKGLKKKEAVDKMVKDRMIPMAGDLGLELASYEYKPNALHMVFRKEPIKEAGEAKEYKEFTDQELKYVLNIWDNHMHIKYHNNPFFKSVVSQLKKNKRLTKKQWVELEFLLKHGQTRYEAGLSTKN
jgi:hypothetical protein